MGIDRTIAPVIDRTYALRDTAAAFGHIAQRHTQGKAVVIVSDTTA